MKTQRYVSALAAALFTLGATSAIAAAGGGHGGGGGGAGGSGGMGGGGMGSMGAAAGEGHAGGVSAGHMSASGKATSNGIHSGDRDAGLARAADRSDTIADRDGVQPGKSHRHSKSHADNDPKGKAFGNMESKP